MINEFDRAGMRLLTIELRKLIAAEEPAGTHRARAAAWTRLAKRCEHAARCHARTADEQDATRRYVNQFAPAFRQTAIEQYRRQTPAQVAPEKDSENE